MSGQNYHALVGDLLYDINQRYFRVRSHDASTPAPFVVLCQAERVRRSKLGMRVTGLRREDGVDLHYRCVIRGLAHNRVLSLTVVLGSYPIPNEVLRPEITTQATHYSLLDDEMHKDRCRSVLWQENIKHPLNSRYTSEETLLSLDKIPEKPALPRSFEEKLQNLTDGVDSGDLVTTLAGLRSLGLNSPRLTNILVCAHLSTVTNYVQCVGIHTCNRWWHESGDVFGEQRVYSLLGLAWRRRHYFVFHALQKFESYAKSGMLRYMVSEHAFRESEMRNVTAPQQIPEGPLQIIIGYMTPFFPHPLDMESIMVDDHDQAFGNRSKLVQGYVISEEDTNTTFQDEVIRQALGGQLITNGNAFKPYEDPMAQPTDLVTFAIASNTWREVLPL
jgi:hypothetical protein